MIRGGEDFLEDALYDDRVIPPVVWEILIATFKQLTASWSREGATPTIQGTVKAPNLIG